MSKNERHAVTNKDLKKSNLKYVTKAFSKPKNELFALLCQG